MTRLSVFLAVLALSLVSLHPVPAAAQQMAAADSSMQPSGSVNDTSTHVRGTAHSTSSHKHHAAKTEKKPKVDINSATDEQLETLPGVTEAMADKIVQNRPYKSQKELVSKKVMTQAEYDKIHSHIVAKQAPAASTTK